MAPARPLPLADASARLRGKPGRPRTRPPATAKADPIEAAALRALAPRLVDLEGAATYMGRVSVWTIRDLIDNGSLPRVRVPLPGGRELRRVLVDVRDLDRLIEQAKDGPA
jgi:hypothetical protein